MPISNVNRIKTISTKLISNDASIKTIYSNSSLTIGDELMPDYKIVSINCFIKNLRAFAIIKSLDQVSLPDFELTDSDTTKLYKTLDAEWGSARKQITLYISNQVDVSPSGIGWFKVGSLSLLNPSGYPYRIYNLMDLYTDSLAIELGDNGKIGVQIENVGYGLLASDDEVTIHGSYVEEIFVQSPDPAYVAIGTSISNAPTTFPLTTVFRVSASDLLLSDGELVTAWQQPNTSAVTVNQQVEANKPIYKTNVLNNKSAVYFDGFGKSLTINKSTDPTAALSLIPSTNDWLIYLVAKFDDPTTSAFSSFSELGDFDPHITINGNTSTVGSFNPYASFVEISASYTINTSWNIYILRRQNNLVTLYINGAAYILGGLDSSISPDRDYMNNLVIGSNQNSDNSLNGYIAELGIIHNHTNADINKLGNYFRSLYNLTWVSI